MYTTYLWSANIRTRWKFQVTIIIHWFNRKRYGVNISYNIFIFKIFSFAVFAQHYEKYTRNIKVKRGRLKEDFRSKIVCRSRKNNTYKRVYRIYFKNPTWWEPLLLCPGSIDVDRFIAVEKNDFLFVKDSFCCSLTHPLFLSRMLGWWSYKPWYSSVHYRELFSNTKSLFF